jgi:hypothetical protein
MIEPSSRPQTNRHCIGRKIVAVKAAPVSALSSWLRTPGGLGSSLAQISSRLIVLQVFIGGTSSPVSYNKIIIQFLLFTFQLLRVRFCLHISAVGRALFCLPLLGKILFGSDIIIGGILGAIWKLYLEQYWERFWQ